MTRSGTILVLALCSVGVAATVQSDHTTTVAVSVAGSDGSAVTDLSADDVVVRLDGREMPVTGVRLATASNPLSIVLVTSGVEGVAAQPARAALRTFVEAVASGHPSARLGVMLDESARAPALLDVGRDIDTLSLRIGRFFETGAAAPLDDSLLEATRALGTVDEFGRTVVVLDGSAGRRDEILSPERALGALGRARASLFVVAVEAAGPGAAAVTEGRIADVPRTGPLEVLAAAAGGWTTRLVGTAAMDRAMVQVARLLLSRYVVTFSGAGSNAGGTLRVGVRRAGVKVVAPAWQ